MIKMLMPMSTHECVAPASGLTVLPVASHSGSVVPVPGTGAPFGGWFADRDRAQRGFGGSTAATSFLRLPVTQLVYTELETQLVLIDPRTAVSNGNPGLRTWSPPV